LDGNQTYNRDYVLQRGDLIGGGGVAYVLREGETALPQEVQKIWEHGLKCRDIFCKNVKADRTAGETLEILKRKLEEAGYVYIERQKYDRNPDP